MRNAPLTILVVSMGLSTILHAQNITTIAGGGSGGLGDGGMAITAQLNHPGGVGVDGSGNLYIADCDNNRIRKVNSAGFISTIAGTGTPGFSGDGGAATLAKINTPLGVAIDATGNIYFSDVYNQRIRKISSSGVITTVAGTGTIGYNGDDIPATAANLNFPHGVAVDNIGNVYFSDFNNNRIRKVNASGIISTYAGVGISGYNGDNQPATLAQLNHPYGIALDAAGNLFIADLTNSRVRKVSVAGTITTIVGNGTPGFTGDGTASTNAQVSPASVAVDNYGNIYVSDAGNHVARKISSNGIINTVAGMGLSGYNGDNISATQARLSNPTGIATDANGAIFIADFGNNRVRYIKSTVEVAPVERPTKGNMTLYPNPCRNRFTIIANTEIAEPAHVYIFNLAGQLIKELEIKTNEHYDILIDIPTGIYTVYVRARSTELAGRITVQ